MSKADARPTVTLELPSLLRSVLPGTDALTVRGDTIEDALEDAFDQVPGLRVHLCDESGKFRRHVLCFVNDINAQWLDRQTHRLNEGDTITILQAVSGG